MNNQDGKSYFSLGIKNTQLQRDAEQAVKIFNSIGDEAEREGKRIDDTFNKIGKAAAAYFTATQIWEFGKAVVNVRKEIENFEISFNTLLGSKEKGKAFFEEIKEFAVKTPLQLNDIAGAAQTLLGFGIEANRIMPILRQLGDISMGNAERFKALALAFAQATSAGKLQGQDLMQMINAGFNPLNEIAKKTGKSIGELKEDMSKGKISAEDLADALNSATAQGGQFYGMLEQQSKGIEGALSNLEGAWNDALNEIGENSQEVFTDAIELATLAVQNYDVFIKAILALAAAYGTYKAALMATYVIQKAQVLMENIRLVMMFRKELGLLTAAQQAFNLTALKNPYILLASAIVGVVTALVLFNNSESEAEKTVKRCNEELKQQAAELEALKNRQNSLIEAEKEAVKATAEEINEIELLSSAIHDETNSIDDRRKAIKQMQSIVPDYHAELDEEGRLHRENTNAIEDHITSLNRLAYAQALQSKRVEIMVQKANAEVDRREAVVERDAAQADVDQKAAKERVEQEKYDAQPGQSARVAANKTTGWKKVLIQFGQSGREMKMVNAAVDKQERSRTNLDEAEKNLRAAEAVLDVAQGKVDVADARIDAANEDLAVLDQMLDDYDAELKKLLAQKGKGSGNETNKRAANYTTLLGKQKVEAERAATDLAFAVKQSEIDAMKDGSEKVIEQMKLDHARELEELEREKDDFLQRKIDNAKAAFEANPDNKDKVFDGSGISLTQAEIDAFAARKENLIKTQLRETENLRAEEKRSMNEYLREYGSYLEKRNAIIALYNEQMNTAANEGERLFLTAQMREELSELDIEANKATSAISKLFADMTDKTVKDMRTIANEAQKALDFLIAGEWDEQKGLEFGMTKETFETLRNSPDELEKIRNGIRDCREEADKAEGAFGRMANGLKKLFDAGNDANKTKKALSEIESGLGEVLDLASFLSDTFSSLGDAFGNDTLTDIADGINVAMDAVDSTMAGANAGAMFGPWGAAAGAAIGLVTSLTTSLSKLHDKKHEKAIARLQEKIDNLKDEYDELGNIVEKTYSGDKAQNLEEQNKKLEDQKALIQEQIDEEKEKKDSDADRIKEWGQQMEDIDALIAENQEKAIDAIFGEDLKSAIENFADAYADAWADGGNKAQAAKDVVKKMMQQMVTESIKAAIQSSTKMEEIRQKLQEFYADNVLTQWEQDYVYKMAGDLQKELDEQFGWADSLMSGGEADQNSTKRGFEAMSQDSADELNGRFTAVQLNTEQMKVTALVLGEDVKAIRIQVANNKQHIEEIRNLALLAVGYLETIAKNTNELYEMNERLGKIEKNTRGL